MKIKLLRDVYLLKAGTVVAARTIPREGLLGDPTPEYQIIEGPAIGMRISYESAVPVKEERTYSESEYNEIKARLDKAIEDLTRHAQELVELRNDKAMLLQQIERTVDEQKVELPREVAEAIEDIRKDGHDVDYIIRHLTKSVGPIGRPSDRLLTLKNFAGDNRGYDLIMALINGYTIEQTPAEKLTAKVEELIYGWIGSPVDEMDVEEIHRLADRIVERAEEILT